MERLSSICFSSPSIPRQDIREYSDEKFISALTLAASVPFEAEASAAQPPAVPDAAPEFPLRALTHQRQAVGLLTEKPA